MKHIITIFKLLSPLFIGIVIAWLIRPILIFLENKGINRIVSLIIIYILIIFLIYILMITFIPKFILEFEEFIKILPNILNNIKINTNIKEEIICIINDFINDFEKNIPDTCKNIFDKISTIIIGFIISFYVLLEDYNIKKIVNKKQYKLLAKINNLLRCYVKSTLISSFIVFILSTIVFYIFNLDNALLLGFISGITNIIPFIGPYIGASVPILIAFTKNTTLGIIIAIILFIIQTIEGNIINPVIMKKNLDINPIATIISLIIFGHFFGIVGMIFAIPIIVITKEVYFYLKRKYNYL